MLCPSGVRVGGPLWWLWEIPLGALTTHQGRKLDKTPAYNTCSARCIIEAFPPDL